MTTTNDKKTYTTYWIIGLIASFVIPCILTIAGYSKLQTTVSYNGTELARLTGQVDTLKQLQATDTRWLDQKKLDIELYNRQHQELANRFETYSKQNNEDHKSIEGKLDKLIDILLKK